MQWLGHKELTWEPCQHIPDWIQREYIDSLRLWEEEDEVCVKQGARVFFFLDVQFLSIIRSSFANCSLRNKLT